MNLQDKLTSLAMLGATWVMWLLITVSVVGVAVALARPEVLGIRGAAIAQALTLSFSAVARLVLVRRFLGIWPFDRDFLRLAVPAVLGGGAMAATHLALPDERWLVDLAGSFLVGGVVYATSLVAVGLRPGERRAVMRVAGRVLGRGTPA